MRVLLLVLLLALCSGASSSVYYLSPQGDDLKGNGSINYPWFTLEKAWKAASAGDTIFLRGGTYAFTTMQDLTGKDGLSGKLIKIWAYPGEKPVITKGSIFDMQDQSNLIYIESDYLHLKGLEICHFAQKSGIRASSALFGFTSNSIFENLDYHHNGLGMVIRGNSTSNLILNSDFHHNYDPYNPDPYCHADGLDIAETPEGTVNTVRGCRFYANSDDGLDLWNNEGIVVIENCWAWRNGYREDGLTAGGDGAGFKLGATESTYYSVYKRILINNLSVSNRNFGITQNAATCKMFICNNILFDNKKTGIYFSASWGDAQHVIRNNISYKNVTDAAIGIKLPSVDHNSWQPGFTITDQDFKSVDPTQLVRPRKPDGTLPDIDFMHLVAGSDLIDTGIDVGLPYLGGAPDLGAFETMPPAPVVANQPPVVSISSPSSSTSFTSPATITIDAAASDPDGAIIKVEFFQGNVKIGEQITTPYSISWKEVPEGTYFLTAVATDNSNSKTVSAAVSVTVVKPAPTANKLPIVSIASPTKGSSFTAPATITIDVNASDPDGSITKVEIYNGTVKLYEKLAAPYTFTLKDLPSGSYELKAVATDNLKASTTSSYLDLTVTSYYEAREYFNLYPNPNDGRFSIDFTSLLDADSFTVTIVDLIGKTVYREELSRDESTRQFDLSHLNSGTYVIMISSSQILLAQKFIKG
ncbi:MAG: T9SS type A sorting domain-containing protein [Bacteroidales bacterium]|nr:T9SS type A sorting domain-containing protein [Bacteroidales bacterium]